MSKSYDNTIEIFAPENVLKKKIMGIQTDSTPVDQPKPTDDSAILGLYKLVASPGDYSAMVADFQRGGIGYGDFKKRLFAAVWEYFAPQRKRREEILADQAFVENVLLAGAGRARAVAGEVMARVRAAVGI
jgi:tryptophanyl-tRNA synthetase